MNNLEIYDQVIIITCILHILHPVHLNEPVKSVSLRPHESKARKGWLFFKEKLSLGGHFGR